MITGVEMLWLFLIYSFFGWVMETIAAGVKQRHIVNRGLVNGPLCIIYGVAALVITIGGKELHGIWLFAASMIYASFIELLAGKLIERIYHERWWDYSAKKFQLSGYVCLQNSLIWGALGFFAVSVLNPVLLTWYHWIPELTGKILLGILLGILVVDILASIFSIYLARNGEIRQMKADVYLSDLSLHLRNLIIAKTAERLKKAYPERMTAAHTKVKTDVFAAGCSFYKIVMLFFIGAFLGDITETIFCRITAGVWMSRSSVVWGPFSIVWGLAMALATALLYKEKDRSDRFLFLMGTFLGGAYEYLCSVFTELVFGKVFWDYSKIPFNLGGRINLLYCFFWGFAAVVWFKLLYPRFSDLIECIPMKFGKILTWILIAFMSCNMLVSCMAMIRYNQRAQGIPAESAWQQSMDLHYDDARMKEIYPNMLEAK